MVSFDTIQNRVRIRDDAHYYIGNCRSRFCAAIRDPKFAAIQKPNFAATLRQYELNVSAGTV